MNIIKEKINGFDCKFEIFTNHNGTAFSGKATIDDCCIKQDHLWTENGDSFNNQSDVIAFLKNKVTKITKDPWFLHPGTRRIGEKCEKCQRTVEKNSLFQY